jgi:hypothetical protein
MPDADMAVGVDDVLQSENAIGDNEIVPDLIDSGHRFPLKQKPTGSARTARPL